MDIHRIYGGLLEQQGFYSAAIDEYRTAAEFMPNYTYLYIKIGQNYRQLKLYDQALEFFDRAATINRSLGINDPLPYVAIAKTYTQQGEFFIAARNAETALSFNPADPTLYGELGIIRFRARNYEGSLPVLKCATVGCSAAENEDEGVAVEGTSLGNTTVVFYYTYGSVLAALDQCDLAEPVLNEVQRVYANDELISGIVQESLFICQTLRTGGDLPTSTPPPTEQMEDMQDDN
jgi:tetratricopeptide (TPR) repeat protein